MSIKVQDLNTNVSAIDNTDGFYADFKNNGSTVMAVDGSVTPVVFSLTDLPPKQKIILQSIGFIIGSDEIIDLAKFGNVAELTNGILFESGGNSLSIKTNSDVLLVSSSQTIFTAGEGVNTYSVIKGRWDFTDTFGNNAPIITDVESLKITIRDNIGDVPVFRVSCHGILIEE